MGRYEEWMDDCTRWVPATEEGYWYIGFYYERLTIKSRRNVWSIADKSLFQDGNCFPSEEEAESALRMIQQAFYLIHKNATQEGAANG